MQTSRPESAARKGLVPAVDIEAQAALPDEVEADAGHHLELGAALCPIVRGRRPCKRRDALDPGELTGRIEIDFAVLPRARHADTVEERRVHLEPPVEVLHEAD